MKCVLDESLGKKNKMTMEEHCHGMSDEGQIPRHINGIIYTVFITFDEFCFATRYFSQTGLVS